MSVENLSHSLLAALRARYREPDREVAEGVRTLSRLFTKERNALGSDYFADPALRRAYLLYFLPVNLAKVASLLQEMPALPARPLRILDVGSGPGVGALAVLGHLTQLGVAAHEGSEVIAVDRSRRVQPVPTRAALPGASASRRLVSRGAALVTSSDAAGHRSRGGLHQGRLEVLLSNIAQGWADGRGAGPGRLPGRQRDDGDEGRSASVAVQRDRPPAGGAPRQGPLRGQRVARSVAPGGASPRGAHRAPRPDQPHRGLDARRVGSSRRGVGLTRTLPGKISRRKGAGTRCR